MDIGKIEIAVRTVKDQAAFIKVLLAEGLDWPVERGVTKVKDIAYGWTKDDLQIEGLDKNFVDGQVWQIQPLDPERKQPWGIFLLEFNKSDVFSTGRGITAPLRRILRRVVPKRRQQPNHAVWDRENLLFICTHEYKYFSLAYFKQPPEGSKTAPLAIFGWGPDIPARTAVEFNLPALAWPGQDVSPDEWVAQWASAFDVEKVTRKFYEEYAAVFTEVEVHMPKSLGNNNNRHLYTQLLMNRLMFLRFIERKGWLRLGNNTNYLQELYTTTPPNTSFYKTRLRRLFFEGLASEKHAAHDIIGDVPFLNGGLFEEGTLDRKVADIPNAAFEFVMGRAEGIFYRYNFTVEESTPLDIQVAVDPEMLGKVFEELVTGRHKSGSYYTPRPVVAFMCREALKGYVTDATRIGADIVARLVDNHVVEGLKETEARRVIEALDNLKAVDPACGSGAYLLGLLQEMISLYRLLYSEKLTRDSRSLYDLKLQIISNNLYGVDIDPFAANIAMLRLWLSISVDSDRPLPLPNLDFKIETGDSLLGPCREFQRNFAAYLLEQRAKRLIEKKDEYLRCHGSKKAELFAYIRKEEDDIAAECQFQFGKGVIAWPVHFAEVFFGQPERIETTFKGEFGFIADQGTQKGLKQTIDSKPGGFDIVLANPPYVRKEEIPPKMKPILRERFGDAVTGRSDLYCSFYARGVELLRDGGMHVFVCSSSWLDAGYGAPLQSYLLRKCHVVSIVDSVVDKQFSTANVNTIISVVRKDHAGLDKDVRFVLLKSPFATAIDDQSRQVEVAVPQHTLLERGTQDHKYLGGKWGGKYLRAPDIYKHIFVERGGRFSSLSQVADVIGYIHDNNTGDEFPEKDVLWSLRDARRIRVRPHSDSVRRVGIKPSGNSCQWAPILFARTMGTRHLVCWCDVSVLGKEFYRITPHQKMSVLSIVAQLNSTLGVLQREILGIKGLGGGAIKFAAADVEQFQILPDLPEAKIAEAFKRMVDRPVADIEEELQQEDRRKVDGIIFDHLELPQSERVRVYEDTLELVLARRDKARNVM